MFIKGHLNIYSDVSKKKTTTSPKKPTTCKSKQYLNLVHNHFVHKGVKAGGKKKKKTTKKKTSYAYAY